jgi:DEAD/DEAH box helicase domain-containing protein
LKPSGKIAEYIDALLSSDRFRGQVAHHSVLPPQAAHWADPVDPWPPPLAAALRAVGIERLYSHQAQAVDLVRAGRHCVVATPTASGKSLVYNLPFFEKVGRDPTSRALYLFPLKALAQDQLRGFRELAAALGGDGPQAAIYDGDTSAWQRRKIRRDPPHAILTNPEMLHLAILPHHARWADFLARLEILVIDEVHTYRGIMGAHMAQVFRRLGRVCAHYGAVPTVVCSSATVGNPGELARQLTGLEVHTIARSGALRWWKEGRIREIIDYCRSDVRITRELFLLGRRQGHLLFHNKAGQTVRVPVDWRRFAVGSDSGPAACDLEKEPQ